MPGLEDLLEEADRQFTICNACRYCEDYCPVFPALERRTEFGAGDLGHLSSLCHDCRACHQACMYTEPHEFAINIPVLMSEARVATYQHNARPRWLRQAFERGPRTLALVNLAAFAIVLIAYAVAGSFGSLFEVRTGPGAFYDTVSHMAMVIPALLLSAYVVVILIAAARQFWDESGTDERTPIQARDWWQAMREAASMAGMRGGGDGCYFPDQERPSGARRIHHSLVVFGFLLTFGATVTAFFSEQLFDQIPPFPVFSVPVMLGLVGGILVTIGCCGLLMLKRDADTEPVSDRATGMDKGFLYALLAVSLTGLALLALRETALMGSLMLIHLATVMAFFVMIPYGKMVHGVYRMAALLRDVRERREADTAAGG